MRYETWKDREKRKKRCSMETTVIFAKNGAKVVVNETTDKLHGELSIISKDGKSTTCQLDADSWATLGEVIASIEVMLPEELVVETMAIGGTVNLVEEPKSE